MSEERYEIRGKIGQGGVGAVYRAYDTQLRREVAIKRVLADEGDGEGEEAGFSEQATKNLLKEATALSSVQHPHICTVYDAGIDKEGPYVVMELINGKTLDEMVERGTLTYDDFREVAIQSQEAMIAAQDLDLVHRDLKPSNVMVCWLPSGRFQVKLVDFGLAKFSAKPSLQTIDHGDAVFGSIFFMAPEQFERTPLDRRTDMYSLGCMYYYSLAGTYPFNGDSAPQVMASHLQNSVQPLQELRPDLPQWVCDWVMWHLARNMDHRPESARVALEKYLLDETSAAKNGGALPQRSGPQLIMPATSPQANRPAMATHHLDTQTAPQSIKPPSGSKVLTSAQAVRPASAITGGTAVQPAKPKLTANKTAATTTTPAKPSLSNQTAANTNSPSLGANTVAIKQALIHKKKKNTYILIGGGILLAGVLAVTFLGANSDIKEYNRMIKEAQNLQTKEFPTTESELTILLNSLSDDPANSSDYIYRYLNLAVAEDATDIDQTIWDFINSAELTQSAKLKLTAALVKRANTPTLVQMLEYARSNPNDAITTLAVKAAGDSAREEDFPLLLNIMSSTKESATHSASEDALKSIISASSNKSALASSLLTAFDSSINKNHKQSMIRLLGVTGAAAAESKLTESLKSKIREERIAAATAFGDWPSDSPFDKMLDALIDEDDPSTKNTLFKSLHSLLSANRPHNNAEIGNRWMQLAVSATTDPQKTRIINSAVKAKAQWSTTVLNLFKDKSHSQYIQNYTQRAIDQLAK